MAVEPRCDALGSVRLSLRYGVRLSRGCGLALALGESIAAVAGVQVLAAAAVLSLHQSEAWLRRALPYVISVAVGVLLATGAAHLLPEAVETLGDRTGVWITLVVTMLALYTFERMFRLVSGVRAEPLQESKAEDAEAQCAELHGHHPHHHGASKPATLRSA